MSDKIETSDLPTTANGLREIARRYRESLSAPDSGNMFELAYQWQDKPHRHVSDLCLRIEVAADALEAMAGEVERLKGVLDKLARLGNEPNYGNSDGNLIARSALEAKP